MSDFHIRRFVKHSAKNAAPKKFRANKDLSRFSVRIAVMFHEEIKFATAESASGRRTLRRTLASQRNVLNVTYFVIHASRTSAPSPSGLHADMVGDRPPVLAIKRHSENAEHFYATPRDCGAQVADAAIARLRNDRVG